MISHFAMVHRGQQKASTNNCLRLMKDNEPRVTNIDKRTYDRRENGDGWNNR